MSDFYKSLIKIQSTLNAPKGQFNSFGKYNYRSCEDIMVALKPLLAAEGLFQSISDEIVQLGDRFYVKSTATVTNGTDKVSCSAMAREALTKKGMDDSQITGATSSYSRKYCLNGLWNIDDSKDADTNEFRKNETQKAQQVTKGFDPDAVLKKATGAMSSCDMNTLKALFAQYKKELAQYPSHLEKLTEVKDIRKSELTSNP